MPFDNPLRSTRPIATVQAPTSTGGLAATPLPIDEAIAVANQSVKVLVGQPSVGNLPANARVGDQFIFQSNPSTIYVYCPDNLYRAIPMVTVV